MSEEEKVFYKLKTPPQKEKWPQINIPMIRRIIPTLIAQELCSVQPINLPEGTIWPTTVKFDENKKPTE